MDIPAANVGCFLISKVKGSPKKYTDPEKLKFSPIDAETRNNG